MVKHQDEQSVIRRRFPYPDRSDSANTAVGPVAPNRSPEREGTPSPDRALITASHYWVPDVDSGWAGSRPPAAQENGE
jgi:hypothetical protein